MLAGRSARIAKPERPVGHRAPEREAATSKPVAAGTDCATAFQAIARDCLARMAARRSGIVAGEVEAVHQMRIAIARLRAAVAFFASATFDAAWPQLKQELAWLHALLGDVRDADVTAALAHRRRYREWAARAGVQDAGERETLHRRVAAGLRSARFRRLMAALSQWVERGPWMTRQGGVALLEPYRRRRLARWHARLVRKGRDLAGMGARRRHRLRLRAKRYRYVLEALGDICPAKERATLQRLHRPVKRLQQALGDLRDLQRLRHVGAASSGRPPGYRRRKKRLMKAAHAALGDLARSPPSL